MMLNVGVIAKTYGMLPSYVVEHANTYDLMIADVMSSWEEYQHNKAMGKNVIPNYTQEELIAMLKKAKDNE
jgi:hypothetical protein